MNMQRHEYRQAAYEANKNNRQCFIALALIAVAFLIVGAIQ